MKARQIPPRLVRVSCASRAAALDRPCRGNFALHALVIEDDALIAMAIEDVLRDHGFATVEIVANADHAIASVADSVPDFVTCDVQLFESNGIDAVQAIWCTCSVPVVFITGSAKDVSDRLPGVSVLTKPFRASDLIALI